MDDDCNILYVDDEDILLRATKAYLERSGKFLVDTAESANEGLNKIVENNYDAIISDYEMPDMNGIEFLSKVRSTGNDIPFIIFTGRGREDVVIDALNNGVDFYLQKGGQPKAQFAELTNKISQAVRRKRAENEIEASKKKALALLNAASEAEMLISSDGIILALNSLMAKRFGKEPKNLLEMNAFEILPPGLLDLEIIIHKHKIVGTDPFYYEESADGRHYRTNINPVLNQWGEIGSYAVFSKDLTEQVNAEESLASAKEHLDVTLKSIGDGVIVTDENCIIQSLNRIAEDLTGWSEEDARGKSVVEVFRLTDLNTNRKGLNPAKEAMESGEIVNIADDVQLESRSGVTYIVGDSAAPIKDQNSQIKGSVIVFRDITEEKEAHEYKYKLASIIESAEDAIVGTDIEGTISSWNKGAEAVFGYREGEVLGKNIDLISAEGYEAELQSIIAKLKRGEKVCSDSTRRKRKDGKIIDISLAVSPIFNEYNEIIGVSGILRDISDIVEARRAIEEQNKWNSTVLRSIGDAIISTDTDCNVTYMNPVAESLTGWTLSEARNQPLGDIFKITNEYTGDVVESPVEKVLREGKVVGLANHTILTAKDGTIWPIDDSGAPIMDANGEISGAVIVFREISARKNAEKRLRASESKYRALFNSTGAATVIIDREGTIILSNAGYEKLSGYSSDEIDGRMKWMDFVDEESLTFMAERSGKRDGLLSPYHDSYEFTFIDRSGKSHAILLILESIEGSGNSVCNLIDISDQKKIQNDLFESEHKMAAILNSMPDIVVQKDSDLRIVWANDAAKKLNPDLLGRTCYEAFLGQKDPCKECNALNAIESGEIHKKTVFHENVAGKGDSYWEKTSIPIVDTEGNCHSVVELTKDITKEKEAWEYKNQLALIIESAEDGIIGTDMDGTITSWNTGAEVTFGYTEDEALGKNIDLIYPEGHETELESVFGTVTTGGRVRHHTTKRKRKDGKIIDISLTVSPIFNENNEITGVSGILRDIGDIVDARREIEEHNKWNATVLRSIGDAIISTDTDCNVTYMNPVAESLTGWTLTEARNQPISEIFKITNEYTGDVVESPVEKVLREGKVVGLANHTILTAKDGTVWPIDDSGAPIMDANGDISGAVIVFREISARKKAEKSLHASESKYRALFNSTGAATVIIDKEGTILLSNAGYEKLSGYSSDEIDGRMKWMDFVDEESLTFMAERSGKRDGLSSPYHDSYEFTFTDRFGKSHAILVILESIEGSENAVCNLIDISEQKNVQNALFESENKLQTILNSLPDIISQKDSDLRVVWANDAAKNMNPDIIGKTCYEAYFGKKEPCMGCNALDAIESCEIKRKTVFHRNVSGKGDSYWEKTSIPLMDHEGNCYSVVELTKDVTPRIHSKGKFTFQHSLAEKLSATSSLGDAEKVLFESLLEIPGIDSGMLYLKDDLTGGFSLAQSKGITEEYRKSVSYLDPQSGCVRRLADKRPIYGCIDDISPNLLDISTFEGIRSFAYIPIVANEEILGACFLISHTNIDVPEFSRQILESTNDLIGNSFSRVITEEKLRESGERLDIAIKSAEFFVWEYAVGDKKIKWNNNLLNRLGYSCDDVVDSDWWSSLIYPEDQDERMKHLGATVNGTEEFYSIEYRIQAFSGEWRWLSVLGKATNRDSRGTATHLVGVIQDITKMKENENALKVANKKLNLLSSITRHDILNQVTPALMYLEMTRDFCNEDASLIENLDIIENCVNVISSQIAFTKDYQDLGLELPVWQDIYSTVAKARISAGMDAIDLNISGICEEIEVFADPMFEKIFFNLFDNSVRHGEGVSEISVCCREDDRNIKITCRDNGAGIPMDMKKKIFSKGIGKNTGLGLFLTKEILDITGIDIEENGIPGECAQFEISVPNGKWRYTAN